SLNVCHLFWKDISAPETEEEKEPGQSPESQQPKNLLAVLVQDPAAAHAGGAGHITLSVARCAGLRLLTKNDFRLAGPVTGDTRKLARGIAVDAAHARSNADAPPESRKARDVGAKLGLDFGGALLKGCARYEIAHG